MNNFADLLNVFQSIEMPGSGNNNNNDGGNTLVQRVSVKVPPFWFNAPDIWFVQVEAQFANANITTDDSKFNTVVGAIDTQVLNKVRSAVLNPPAGTKYENLKAMMLKEYGDSDYARMKKLFSELSLGDNKASFLLNEMRRLGGDNVGDDVLKALWMNQLPLHVRTILATSTATLDELAATADKIIEVSAGGMVQQINATNPSDGDRMAVMERQINQLVSSVNSIKNQFGRSRSRSRSDKYHGQRSQTPKNSHYNKAPQSNTSQSDLCWYHVKFGDSAKKCKPTCPLYKPKN